MELELKKRVLKINVYGEKVEVSFPTVGQYKEYQEVVKSNKTESDFDLMKNFIVMLGFKDSLIENMEPEHVTTISNKLLGIDKKK